MRRKNEFWYRTLRCKAKGKACRIYLYIVNLVCIVHGDWKCFYILHVSVASMFLCKYTILGLESAKPRPRCRTTSHSPPLHPTLCGNENGPKRGPFNVLLCQLHMQVVLSDISDLQQAEPTSAGASNDSTARLCNTCEVWGEVGER